MSLFNNSKDKDTKAKMYGEPCEGTINPETTGTPTEVNPRAELNKNRLMKITIESPDGSKQVFEVHGVAMTTIRDIGDKYQSSVGVVGTLTLKEQMELYVQAKHELVPELEKLAIRNGVDKYSIKDLMGMLKETLEGM